MRRNSQAGYSLPELLIAMAIMLIISGAAVTALLKMQSAQVAIWNRTQMHSGVRGATEVLQQEVGQAGRIALPMNSAGVPYTVTMGAVAVGSNPSTITTTKTTGDATEGMFVGQKLLVGTGTSQETVTVTALSTTQITATFANAHNAGEPVLVLGAFGTGIVPPAISPTTFPYPLEGNYAPGGPTFTYPNGSNGTVLKLYGDINADGNMVYIEYICDAATDHNLYRNVMAWNAGTKPAGKVPSKVLLSNVIANPNSTPCFTYQTAVVGGNVYVTDVAITLTVQTQLIDPVTKHYQTQTKALLNVSPRNTFNAWQMASLGMTSKRIQPIPPNIRDILLP